MEKNMETTIMAYVRIIGYILGYIGMIENKMIFYKGVPPRNEL